MFLTGFTGSTGFIQFKSKIEKLKMTRESLKWRGKEWTERGWIWYDGDSEKRIG